MSPPISTEKDFCTMTKKLKIEVADTPAALAHGLMGIKDLPFDSGMLFKFPAVLEASFWGKDTHIPLDIAFVDRNNKITGIKNIVPMSTKAVRSDGDCIIAIEANAGYFRKNNILPGQTIEISDNEVLFK